MCIYHVLLVSAEIGNQSASALAIDCIKNETCNIALDTFIFVIAMALEALYHKIC